MKRSDHYLIGTTILAVIGCSILGGKVSKLENTVNELNKNFQLAQIQRPASYLGSSCSDDIFRIELNVLEEFKTIPADSEVKPPLVGYSYFCKTPDNVGYYVFARTSSLREGDKINGWFSSTGLMIHNDNHDRNFSLIAPIYVEKLELQGRSILQIKP